MRSYVEPLGHDQRPYDAAVLRLVDVLQKQVAALQAEVEALRRDAAQR
jgi:hypothetical protein